MKKILNGMTKICGGLVFLLLLVMIVAVLFPLIPPFRGYFHTRTVLTGSMAPAVPTGSLVINHYIKDRDLAIGDIVTFKKPETLSPVFITHRIVNIDKSGLLYLFQTEGDANITPDISKINQANIEGKVIGVIPYLGYLVDFLKTPIAFAILVFLPLCLFIFRQLRDAWKIWQEMSLGKDRKNSDNLGQKVAVLAILFFLLQTTVLQKVYASFRSSPVKITAVTLATASDFGCNGKTDKNCHKCPWVEFIRSFDRKYMTFIIRGLSYFKNLSYIFTYDGKETTFGVVGKQDLSGENEFSKEIQLGSCSEKDCVYQINPKNFSLDVKLNDSDGKETEINAQEE